MVSVEHNDKYLNLAEGSTYIHAPLKPLAKKSKHFPEVVEWYDAGVLEVELPKYNYDAIIVDGPPSSSRRPGFYIYRHLFNLNVPLFIDDVARSNEIKMCTLLSRELNISRIEMYDTHQRHMWALLDTKDKINEDS
jgi:hypothetical protein